MGDGWQLRHDVDLRDANSFGVPARAARWIDVHQPAALPAALHAAGRDAVVWGGGSNLLLVADVDTVLHPTFDHIDVIAEDAETVTVRAGAGLDWHGFVMAMLQRGLYGLENLVLIPGTVGAAPIQNIGAYGVEVMDRIAVVHVVDRDTAQAITLPNADCGFRYRDSRFKDDLQRYLVTAVDFTLSRTPQLQLDYAGIREELAARDIATPTPQAVADAVIALRRRKLPDPAVIGNAGSFFKNPLVPQAQADALLAAHPRLPCFQADAPGLRKLSAAWLIDQCGWKGHRDDDAGVSPDHALVLVNHDQASGAQLLALARRIGASVQERFGVTIEPEPRLLGAAW